MNTSLIYFFVILHVICHFYLQPKNEHQYRSVVFNSLITLIILFSPLLLLGYEFNLFLIGLICALSYFILSSIKFVIDYNKIFIKLYTNPWSKIIIFSIFQTIYIGIIVLTTYVFNIEQEMNTRYLQWILALLLIGRPSNVIFKLVFMQFKPVDQEPLIEQNKTYKNAGAAIGTLERILILICLINQLYSSIGLILTAKSIARYNRITEDPEFSEYYLLGTLSSVLFTIVIYVICFYII